jgi:hypothetical protein
MSTDWLKMRTDLYRDPKICVIADLLMEENGPLGRYVSQHKQCDMSVTRNVMRNATVGSLLSVWGVLRHRGKPSAQDLTVTGVTLSVIDDIADMPGFGEAMKAVGWVKETDNGILFPCFFREYNVEPGKSGRSKAAERQARYREKKKQESDVSQVNNDNVTRNVTSDDREEKRREDIKKSSRSTQELKGHPQVMHRQDPERVNKLTLDEQRAKNLGRALAAVSAADVLKNLT